MDFAGAISREIFDISWYWWIILVVVMIGMMMLRKNIVDSLIAGYVFLILIITLLDRTGSHRELELMPFWSYSKLELRGEIICNYLLFIPLGLLFGLKDKISWKTAVLTAAALSTIIELSQFIFDKGMCEFDDVFGNTMGCFIGFLVMVIIIKVFSIKRKIQ